VERSKFSAGERRVVNSKTFDDVTGTSEFSGSIYVFEVDSYLEND